MQSTVSSSRLSKHASKVLSIDDFEVSSGPPERLSPVKVTGFCHRKGAEAATVVPQIYSNKVSWLKPKDSKIFYEVPNTFITRLLPRVERTETEISLTQNRVSSHSADAFKEKVKSKV
jgi:hypothetical protein